MWIWRHDYFAHPKNIYLFWVDVNLAAWLFCPPKWHLLVLQVEWVDVISVGKDIAIIFCYEMRSTEFVRERNSGVPNYGIRILIWWLSNSRILKNIWLEFRIQKLNQNSASDGGPRNRNQRLEFPTKHGDAICWVYWYGYWELVNIVTSTSLWWVGRGHHQRVLLNIVNQPQKNWLVISLILF